MIRRLTWIDFDGKHVGVGHIVNADGISLCRLHLHVQSRFHTTWDEQTFIVTCKLCLKDVPPEQIFMENLKHV
jgi:hypothetical protein